MTHPDQPIIIVSGLPRSGTSMMMRMLEAGGLELVTDGIRKADDDNPRGYYEYERVKKIEEDSSWVPDCRGKAVKMVSMLLYHLPKEFHYKVIFMRRKMPEVLASQRRMLEHRGEQGAKVGDEEMAKLFEKHLKQIGEWLAQQPNIEVLYVNYNDVVQDPKQHAPIVNEFLGGTLDTEKMVQVVERQLYRQRA